MRCPRCKMPTLMKLGGHSKGCGSCGYFEKGGNTLRNKTCETCKRKTCSYIGTRYNACNNYTDR